MITAGAQTSLLDTAAAVRDIHRQFSAYGGHIKCVVYFASVSYDMEVLAAEMHKAFGGVCTMGCTSQGEIFAGKISTGTLVAMAFGDELVDDIKVCFIDEISEEEHTRAVEASENFARYFGVKHLSELSNEEYIGLLLADGNSPGVEYVLEDLVYSSDILFNGASSGDNFTFDRAEVFYNGKHHRDAAVAAVLKLKRKFTLYKTQSVKSLGKHLTATFVHKPTKRVLTLNDRPALRTLAEIFGLSTEELSKNTDRYYLGINVYDDMFVRAIARLYLQDKLDDVGLYCSVEQNILLEALTSTNIVEDTAKQLETIKANHPNMTGMLTFNCVLRSSVMDTDGMANDYEKLYEGFTMPIVGFNCYGEYYMTLLNNTQTFLIFE